jgi:glycosyltransferase involved in cell wall biosynthesis
MRVALVGPYPTDPGNVAGGVEASFVNLVQGLAELEDLELHVISFVPETATPHVLDVPWGSVHYVPAPSRLNNVTMYRSRRRSLRRVLDELGPQIVHAQDALGYGYVCLRAARREPVVVSIHGIVRETSKSVRGPLDRLRVTLAGVAVETYCVRHARYLVQPTPYPHEYFGREIRGRIVDVGNAVQDELFSVEPLAEPGRLLYAGGVNELKRVLDLVDALALVHRSAPGATLRIAGDCADRAYCERVSARIRERGLDGSVTMLGRLRSDELREEYRRASMLLLASRQETSPMVIAEAMAAGVPVVATRVGGIPHLVDEGRTGFLVDVGDVAALARSVADLLADEARRKDVAEAARRRAEERFRRAKVAARVREVYGLALDESRR